MESRGETRRQRQKKMSSCFSRIARAMRVRESNARAREAAMVKSRGRHTTARAHTHNARSKTQRCTATHTCNKRHCRNAQPEVLIANLHRPHSKSTQIPARRTITIHWRSQPRHGATNWMPRVANSMGCIESERARESKQETATK